MALNIDSIKDTQIHDRPPVIRGWEFRYPRTVDELFWGECFFRSTHYFRPVQMRLTHTDFAVYAKESSEELATKLRELLSITTTDIDKLCREYVDKVSDISAVREILVVEEEEVATIWTIIKALPFEDSLREPIYAAQSQVLRSLGQDITLDFYVLNESELPADEKLSDIIPSNARRIWRR